MQLFEQEQAAGVVFHFGYNTSMLAVCRQFQCVLEVVDANRNSLNMFLEYGQCHPPCSDETRVTGSDCIASIAAEKFAPEADEKLDVVRAFRDNWLLQQEGGLALYEMYYFLSPGIVAEIEDRPDQEAIWQDLYYNGFLKCLDLIEQQKPGEAKAFYIDLMRSLTRQFLSQGA
jgi:hypothetical protein